MNGTKGVTTEIVIKLSDKEIELLEKRGYISDKIWGAYPTGQRRDVSIKIWYKEHNIVREELPRDRRYTIGHQFYIGNEGLQSLKEGKWVGGDYIDTDFRIRKLNLAKEGVW